MSRSAKFGSTVAKQIYELYILPIYCAPRKTEKTDQPYSHFCVYDLPDISELRVKMTLAT